MTDVDTSIYQQNPANQPLNMLSTVAGINSSLNQARLFQQEFAGKLALGKLYSQAPLDANGQPDQNWIQQNAGKAGIMAPEATQAALQAQAGQLAIQSQKLQNLKTRASIGAAALMPVASNPNASASDIVDTANDLVSKGLLSPQENHQITMALAAHLSTGTPQTFARGLAGKLIGMGGNPEYGQKYLSGDPTTVETNNSIQPGTRDVTSGAFTPAGAAIPKGLPPTTPVYQGASARPQYAGSTSQPNPFAGGTQAPPPGAAPIAPVTSASLPPQQNPTAPQAGAPVKSAPQQDNNTYAAPPPAYEKELEPALARANDVVQRGNDAIKVVPSLQGVLQYADAGGPAQETNNKVQGLLKDSPLGKLFSPDTTEQARFEILNKFSSDVSGQNMSANARNELESNVQALSNPNATQFPQALRTVAKFLLGRTAAAKAQADYMSPLISDPNVQPKDILDAEKNWRQNYDQNLFELPYMNPDEKRNLATSMGPVDSPQHKKFENHLRFMVNQGLIDPNDL